MPNTKKVFQIEINGLTQSVDAVKALNDQLKDLEDRIKRLQKAKVEVKVSGNDTTQQKSVVSGNRNTNDATKQQTSALQELARLQQQVSRQQAQSEALLTDEYREQLKQKIEITNQVKQSTNEIKAQVAQQQVMTKEYANTLAGQRQYLADLKQALANTELNTEEWNKLGDEVLRVNTNVKQMEESYGVFTRNVGNYASAAKGFKELADGTKEYENTINGLTAKLNDLEETMRSLDVGSEQYKQAQNEIRDLQGQLRELQAGAESAGNAMEEKLGVRFTTVINGISYTFDDVNQGIGLLEDKLYSMAQAGNTTSKEFRAIQNEITRLRRSVVSVDAAIDNMIGTAKGLRNITSLFAGFTGIASLGQGLQGLFGGNNAKLDESIQKFTSLSMVLQGLVAIQTEMAQKATAFGKAMDRTNTFIDTFISILSKLPVINFFTKLNKDLDTLNKNFDLTDHLIEFQDELGKSAMGVDTIKKAMEGLSQEAKKVLGDGSKGGFMNTYQMGKQGMFGDMSGVDDFINAVDEARKSNADFAKSFDNVREAQKASEEITIASMQAIDGLSSKIGRTAANSPKLAKGIQLIAVSLRSLAKATIVLALLQALIWVIEKLGDAVSWAWGKIKGVFGDTGDVLDGAKLLTNELEIQREAFDKLAESADKAKDSQKEFNAVLGQMKQSATDAGNELKNFVASMDRAKALSDQFSEGNGFWSVGFGGAPDDIDEWIRNYKKLMDAVQRGQDRSETVAGGWGWWNTQEDAMEDLANNQRAVIRDIMNEINKIDFDNPEQSVKQFRKIWEGELGEIRKQALANIENLFPDEIWAKNLKQLIDNYREMADTVTEKNDEMAESAKKTNAEIEAMKKQLRDINTYNLQFTPGQWRFGYERQSLKDQYEDERKAAEGNAKLIAAIDKKYYNDRRELLKKQAQEVKQVNFEIQQNELDARKEGLNKRIAQLELSRQKELNAARQSDINVGEQLVAINRKYDALILQEKKDFYKQVEEAAKERNKALIEQEEQFMQQDLEMARRVAEMQQRNTRSDFENQNHNITENIKYDVNVKGSKGVDERKKYYDQLLKAQMDYIAKKEQLDKQEAKQNTDWQIEDSQNQYKDRLKQLDDFYEEQKRILDEQHEQGIVSEEEYNNELTKLKQKHLEQEKTLQEQANAEQSQIIKQGENEQTRIMQEANDARVQANNEYLKEMTDNLGKYYDDIENKSHSTSKANTNSLGIINYKKEKENLQNTLSEYQNLMSNIDTEYSKLQQKLNNKEISFNDFTQAKEQLDELKAHTEESAKMTQKALDNLVNTVATSVMNVINGYMSAFNDIWSIVSDMRSNELESEEKKLDKQKELLDKELEQIEDAYAKQEEVTQEHKDKINDIEGELSTARGDRRQALIDQLTKEREAELASLQNEQDIQKKKQANEKKQQSLEKQQEALEKKRWQQDKKNKIVQATINTFTAVNNALALQPWWLGLAMSAVALSMGLANVAKISSQQYFADGGLLQGKSHAQGGIPVGNTKIEVEGGEYVVNKNTTMKNLPLLEYINSQRRPLTKEDLSNFYDDKKGRTLVNRNITGKYADGGQLQQNPLNNADLRRLINYQQEEDTRPIVVSVVDIVNASDDLREVQVLSGLSD